MKNPPYLGLTVRHYSLGPPGLGIVEAARQLGVGREQLSDIVNCRSRISAQMAIRLEREVSVSSEIWNWLQPAWALAQASNQANRTKA